MKLYILDWNGTLTTLVPPNDPWSFVKALQKRGHFVFLWTGGYSRGNYSQAQFNLVAGACDTVLYKDRICDLMKGIHGDEDYKWEVPPTLDPQQITEIVISDDGYDAKDFLDLYADLSGKKIRFVAPHDLMNEVTP